MIDIIQQSSLASIVGFVAGLLTAISMLPQLIKTIKQKKADDISVVMLLVLMFGVSLWIVYGFLKTELPIIITNMVSFLLNVWMFVLRKKYRTAN